MVKKTVKHDTYEHIHLSKTKHGVSRRCIGGGLRLIASAISEHEAKMIARLMTIGSAHEALIDYDKKSK